MIELEQTVSLEVNRLSVLSELKPIVKQRVKDLVSQAGIDVSDWAKFKGGPSLAASNPKYCYEWAFVADGRIVVLNLWYNAIRERRGRVFVKLNMRERLGMYRHQRMDVPAMRAKRLDLAIQHAATNRLPIRVVVLDGKMREAITMRAAPSKVKRRLLDPLPWAVTSYDWNCGSCVLTRGAQAGHFVDQYSAPNLAKAELERHMVSGLAYTRDPGLRERALNRAKGACEYCSKSGFTTADGKIFLETHHVIPLGEDGLDTEDNIAALCPNHHREAHYGARAAEIRKTLTATLRRFLGGKNRSST